MRRFIIAVLCCFLLSGSVYAQEETITRRRLQKKVEGYFEVIFKRLAEAAEKAPTVENFREIMKPIAEDTDGFYGATLIDPDFVIRQVYYPSHFLARGFSLRKVKELKNFYRMMKESPAPQLSEPQKLIAMRYPVIKDGRLVNIVSLMVRSRAFLKATGMDRFKAFRFICDGKIAKKKKGKLSGDYKEITLNLPSTEWVIRYEE